MKKQTLLGTLLGLSLLSGATVAHIEQSEPLQSLRQSYFALLGMTFGPMGDMVKGKICLLYTSPSPRDRTRSRMPSSA